MRTRAKVDANQAKIVHGLRQAGRSVQPLHQIGKGCPDLLVGFGGKNFLLEIKDNSKSKFTPAQLVFTSLWRGQWARVETIEQALEVTK